MIALSKSWQFVEAIEQADDVSAVAEVLVDVAAQYGFSSVFGGLLPRGGEPRSFSRLRPLILVQHVPAAWAERYNQGDYLFRDPVFRRLCEDMNPFTWLDSYRTSNERGDVELIQDGAAAFGLTDGYVIPVATLDGRVAAVSFGGSAVDLSPADAMALNFAVSFAIGHFLKLHTPPRPGLPTLTMREAECLLWAGEGKTDWETSVILGISRSTVIKHIASARDKLGAVNKTHAVALAMRARTMK